MVSFIGDMWKCAINVKRYMENDKEFENIKIIQRYIDNKYCYIVIGDCDMNNGITTFDSETLLNMHRTCNDIKSFFGVDFKFFISACNAGVIIS